MYTVGLLLSFKIALLISIFHAVMKLRKEAKSFREVGLSDSHIRRFYRENSASSCVTVGVVTLVYGSILSFISLAAIWISVES